MKHLKVKYKQWNEIATTFNQIKFSLLPFHTVEAYKITKGKYDKSLIQEFWIKKIICHILTSPTHFEYYVSDQTLLYKGNSI